MVQLELTEMDEDQLVQHCLRGGAKEFKMIVERYRGKAMAMAMNILGNREDAEDACQEAFVKAYFNLEKFDFRTNFSSWFYTILYNRCLDLIRKRRRFLDFFRRAKREVRWHHDLEFDDPTRSLSLKIGEKLIGELSLKERTALFLWAYDGYTSAEIAKVLRCSPSTARVHLYKVRKKLKARMERNNVAM